MREMLVLMLLLLLEDCRHGLSVRRCWVGQRMEKRRRREESGVVGVGMLKVQFISASIISFNLVLFHAG